MGSPSLKRTPDKKLQTRQYIWCATKPDPELWPKRAEWVLEVPQDKFLRIIYPFAWCVLGGISPNSPKKWMDEAIKLHKNVSSYRDIVDKRREKELARPPEHWLQDEILFLDNVTDDCNVLLRFPVEKEWVIHG